MTIRSASRTPAEFGEDKPAFLALLPDGTPALARASTDAVALERLSAAGSVRVRLGADLALGCVGGAVRAVHPSSPAAAWTAHEVSGAGHLVFKSVSGGLFLSRMGNHKLTMRSSADGDDRCVWIVSDPPHAASPETHAARRTTTTVTCYNIFSHDNTSPGALAEYKVTPSLVDAIGVAAVAEEDWRAWKGKIVDVFFDGKSARFVVLDYCADADCDGCCTQNKHFGGNGFLLDLDARTVSRVWGIQRPEDSLMKTASFCVVGSKTERELDELVTQHGGKVDR